MDLKLTRKLEGKCEKKMGVAKFWIWICIEKKEWMQEWMKEWMKAWMKKWKKELMKEWMKEWMNKEKKMELSEL